MAEGRSIGTVFVELDLDPSRYTKSQQQLLRDATSTSLNIEQNFKNLGVKSSAEMDLMRAKITNSFDMIKNSSKATANDILRAEQAKNAQLTALNEQQFGRQVGLIESAKKHWLAATAAITAAYFTMRKVWDLAGTAADFQERIGAMDALGRRAGMTGREILQGMQEAARGLISMQDAADMAAAALNLSLSPQQMIAFTQVSEQLSDVIGGSVKESFDRMTVAAASGRTQTLAQMGILVDLDAAYGNYAAQIGRTTESLSAAEKQQVRLNTILAEARKKTADLGEPVDTARDKMDRFTATMKDLGLTLGEIVLPPLALVADLLTKTLQGKIEIASGVGVEGLAFFEIPPKTRDIEAIRADTFRRNRQARLAAAIPGMARTPAAGLSEEELRQAKRQFDASALAQQSAVAELEEIRKATLEQAEELKKIREKNREADIASAVAQADRELELLDAMAKAEVAQMNENLKIREKNREADIASAAAQADRELELLDATAKAEVVRLTERQRIRETDLAGQRRVIQTERQDLMRYLDDGLIGQETYYLRLEQLRQRESALDKDSLRAKFLATENYFTKVGLAFQIHAANVQSVDQRILETTGRIYQEMERTVSDVYFDVVTGKWEELSKLPEQFGSAMLRALTDVLAAETVKQFTQLLSGWGGLLGSAATSIVDWLGAFQSGLWEVPGGPEGFAAILHPGEMVLPADLAALVRGGGGAGGPAGRGPQGVGEAIAAAIGGRLSPSQGFAFGLAHAANIAIGSVSMLSPLGLARELMGPALREAGINVPGMAQRAEAINARGIAAGWGVSPEVAAQIAADLRAMSGIPGTQAMFEAAIAESVSAAQEAAAASFAASMVAERAEREADFGDFGGGGGFGGVGAESGNEGASGTGGMGGSGDSSVFARGGVFDTRGPTRMVVGEAGRETVAIVRNPRQGETGGGGLSVNLNFYGSLTLIGAGGKDEFMRFIVAGIRDVMTRMPGVDLFPVRR